MTTPHDNCTCCCHWRVFELPTFLDGPRARDKNAPIPLLPPVVDPLVEVARLAVLERKIPVRERFTVTLPPAHSERFVIRPSQV